MVEVHPLSETPDRRTARFCCPHLSVLRKMGSVGEVAAVASYRSHGNHRRETVPCGARSAEESRVKTPDKDICKGCGRNNCPWYISHEKGCGGGYDKGKAPNGVRICKSWLPPGYMDVRNERLEP